jgi:hypothetical protein
MTQKAAAATTAPTPAAITNRLTPKAPLPIVSPAPRDRKAAATGFPNAPAGDDGFSDDDEEAAWGRISTSN